MHRKLNSWRIILIFEIKFKVIFKAIDFYLRFYQDYLIPFHLPSTIKLSFKRKNCYDALFAPFIYYCSLLSMMPNITIANTLFFSSHSTNDIKTNVQLHDKMQYSFMFMFSVAVAIFCTVLYCYFSVLNV